MNARSLTYQTRTYLTQADRLANVAMAEATTEAVKASKEAGTHVGANYGSKSTRTGPKFVDSIGGIPVATVALPVGRCLTTVKLVSIAMVFDGKPSSFGPAVPFSADTHRTNAGWMAFNSAMIKVMTDYSIAV